MSENDFEYQEEIVSEDVESSEDVSDEEIEETEVDLDEIADVSIEVLQTILKPFDIGDITIDEYEGDEGELILDITGDDLGVLIGRYGRTLNALQFMVSIIVHRKLGFYYPVIIDVEGYKNRQREKIESIAKRSASKAASSNQNVELRPMSPYERRIVHTTLQSDPRVTTKSKGTGDDRHVVISPVD